MKLSRKSDYALRVLCGLAERPDEGPVSVRDLADRHDIPRRFLEQIMLDMKSQGWVSSIPGRNGGFVLSREPSRITMGQIVRFFDGVLAPLPCVSTRNYEACSQEGICRFRRVLLDIRNYTARRMDEADLATVVAVSPVTRDEVFSSGFVDGGGI